MPRKAVLAIGLALFAASLIAQPRQWGVWFSGQAESGDAFYAVTMNDAGHLFGQYCYPEQDACVYLLATSTACEEGAQYPVLAATEHGSVSTQVVCGGTLPWGHYRYVFASFAPIDDMVKRSSQIAFVMPPADDQVTGVMFELIGSREAIAAMRATAQAGIRDATPAARGALDQRL